MDFQYCLKTYSFLCKTKQSHQSYHNARDWNSTTQKILKAMIQVIKFWIAKRNPNFHREGKIFASFLFLEKRNQKWSKLTEYRWRLVAAMEPKFEWKFRKKMEGKILVKGLERAIMLAATPLILGFQFHIASVVCTEVCLETDFGSFMNLYFDYSSFVRPLYDPGVATISLRFIQPLPLWCPNFNFCFYFI